MSRTPSHSAGRRSDGEGSVTQRKNGLWQASLMVNGHRQFAYGKTREDVAGKLRKLQGVAEQNGQLPHPGRLTVGDYLHQWLEQAEPRLRAKTAVDYEILVRLHIAPHLGKTLLSKLSALQVARLYATLLREGRSPRRVQQAHGLLHKALGDAHKWGLLASNPAAVVDAPRRERHTPRLWTQEQTQRCISAVLEGHQGGQYGPLLGFLLASGCRVGEALGLRWSDVDWQPQRVRIERQVTEVRGRPQEGPPKTEAGVRTIALPSWGMALLRQQREQVAAWKVGSQRVFPTQVGSVPLQGNVRRSLDSLCAKLGLTRVTVHQLRHISLSLLAMAGVPVKVAQERAGHSTPTMTLRVYTHVLGDGDRTAAAALDALRPDPAAEGSIKM
ncbi:MAG: site-specific integrase [Chloroflexi bacterium]|nr:site-specific integrase [Chloroflexota bacterium]